MDKTSNFDQTNKKRSDFVDRKSLENNNFLPNSESELVLPQKTRFAATTLTEFFFCFNRTKTLTQTKI